MPKRFGTNPADPAEFEKFERKDDGARYRVEHAMVGRLPGGTIARAADFGPAADLDRLVSLGAILPIHGGRAAVEDAGPDGNGLVAERLADDPAPPSLPESMKPDPAKVSRR
jgi:hypothetical protein